MDFACAVRGKYNLPEQANAIEPYNHISDKTNMIKMFSVYLDLCFIGSHFGMFLFCQQELGFYTLC